VTVVPLAEPLALPRRPRATVVFALLSLTGMAAWFVVARPQSEQLTIPAVTSWWWAAAAVAACGVSFWAAAEVLRATSPVRVRPSTAAAAQVAASATKLVSPASAGVVGLNARLLTTHGAPLPVALAAVAASQVAQLLITLAGLAVLLPFAGQVLDLDVPVEGKWLVAVPLAVVVTGAVGALAGRSRLVRIWAALRAAVRPLLPLLRSPSRVVQLLAGSLGLTAALTMSLWACVSALGGSVPFVTAAVVLLVGSALGSAVPTPGGVGGVEGAMVGAFVATGLTVEVALPTVVLFRLVTFWLPMPLGAVALLLLRRSRHL
jgi:glycosyltransferase 2 family protein